MTYREAIAIANGQFARLVKTHEAAGTEPTPFEQQRIVAELQRALRDAHPDPPGTWRTTPPTAPPTGATEATLLANVA
jgi:hypothetical protein